MALSVKFTQLNLLSIKDKMKDLEEAFFEFLVEDHPELTDVIKPFIFAKGKRLRPSLVFLSAGVCGEDFDQE